MLLLIKFYSNPMRKFPVIINDEDVIEFLSYCRYKIAKYNKTKYFRLRLYDEVSKCGHQYEQLDLAFNNVKPKDCYFVID